MEGPKRYLNTEELAQYLGLTKWGVYDMVSRRQIPFIKVSHKVLRFDIIKVDEWMAKKEIGTAKD